MSNYRLNRLVVIAVCLMAAPAWAVTKDWNDGTDNWSNAAAWTPAGVPGAGDIANIAFADGVARTVTYDYTGPAVTLGLLRVDLTGAGTTESTLSIAANTLTSTAEEIGSAGRGTITQSGGTHVVTGGSFDALNVGYAAGSVGTYNLSGGALTTNAQQVIGYLGMSTGNFNQSGGTNTISGAGHELYVGREIGSVGKYTLSGGSLSAVEDENVGLFGNGSFDHSVGTNTVGRVLQLGVQPGATGSYSLSGASKLTVGDTIIVGEGGTGTLTQDGTSTITAPRLSIGYTNGANGTFTQSGGTTTFDQVRISSGSTAQGAYTLNAGTLTVNLVEHVGDSGTASFTQSGGSHVVGSLFVNDHGTFALGGGTLDAFQESIGMNGTAAFSQAGGTNSTESLFIGGGSTTSTYTMSSGTLVTTSAEVIGVNGSGALFQSGGVHTSLGDISLGYTVGSAGSYSLNGGIANAANIFVGGKSSGAAGAGVMTVSGSTASLNVPGTIKVYNTPGSVLNLASGTMNVGGINVGGVPSLFNWTGGTLNITNDVTWDSGAAADSTSRIFGFSLSLSSSRTLKVAGNETIGGNGSFVLTVGSSAVHAVTGNITVKPGGTLSSTSTSILSYSSLTQAGGTITGTLRNVGSYTHQSGTLSAFFVNAGTVSFGSSLNMAGGLSNEASLTVGSGQTLTIGGNGANNLGNFTLNGGTIASGPTFLNSVGGTLTAHGVITPTLTNHGTLIVDGVLSIASSSTNDGIIQGAGTLAGLSTLGNSAGGVINSTNPGGTLVLTNLSNNNLGGVMNVGPTSTLSISGSWTNAGIVNLQGGGSRLSGGFMTNNGTIQGFGTITSTLATSNNGVFRASGGELDFTANGIINSSQSQFQILAGSTAMFLQGMSSNSGTISLTGGTFDNNNRTIQNLGTINGYGTIRTGGLTNTPSKLISVGEGNMDVLGSVINNGVVSIQSGRSAYFFGPVSGSGSFTGTGTAVFLASLSPGNSPASVSFAGGATLGTSLAMELGGTTPGSGYDRLQVAGHLSIGGVLSVSLINGFTPGPDTSFDLFDWGSIAGEFSSLNLPTLPVGQWDTSQLYTTGVLSVVLGGDFNHDFIVNGADYVVWRKGLGTVYSQSDYDVWRAHFGESFIGSGSGSAANGTAVPEPGTLMLWSMAVVFAMMSQGGRRGLRHRAL